MKDKPLILAYLHCRHLQHSARLIESNRNEVIIEGIYAPCSTDKSAPCGQNVFLGNFWVSFVHAQMDSD
jgi:hypothetical protein